MIDTETARTKNVRAVLAKRQIFFARLKKAWSRSVFVQEM